MAGTPSAANAQPTSLSSGWLLTIGITMIVLGSIALGDSLAVTLISVLLLGWLLIGSGILHVINLFRNTETRSFGHILNAIFDLVAGLYFLAHPALGAVTLTLVLAAFLMVSGATRIVAVFQANLPRKFWPLLDGFLSIILGLMLWIHWPTTGLWFIGFALAIGLIFRGWAWVMIALALRGQAAGVKPAPQPA